MPQIYSASRAFFADYAGTQLVVYKAGVASSFPVATIRNDENNPNAWYGLTIVGIEGNSGNRFDRLSDIEKVDIATIVTQLVNERNQPSKKLVLPTIDAVLEPLFALVVMIILLGISAYKLLF